MGWLHALHARTCLARALRAAVTGLLGEIRAADGALAARLEGTLARLAGAEKW